MSDPSFRGVRNALMAIVPEWLQNRPGFQVGFKILWVTALLCDGLIDVAQAGVRAAWPGKGTPDALPLIGQTRGLIQGPFETNVAFEARCIAWLTTWQNMGSDEVLALLIQAYLTAPDGITLPTVRIIMRTGFTVTALPNATTRIDVDPNWNWDGVSTPERSDNWSDLWIVVYPSPAAWVAYTSTAPFVDANWDAAWVNGDSGRGHMTNRRDVDAICQLVRQSKGAHTNIVSIIWTTDASLFVPGSYNAAGNPDGTWSYWGAWGNDHVRRPRRTTVTAGGFVRYWEPESTPR